MLSCYTTNLVAHLRRVDPSIEGRFAAAVALSVRLDADGGRLAFLQHRPVGPALGYGSAATWYEARRGLADECGRRGEVLAVANTRNLPWCPGYGIQDTPHWIRLTAFDGAQWHVVDGFEAVLPLGEQRPFDAWASDEELRSLLTPLPPLEGHVQARDVHALGAAERVPEPGRYRWLAQDADTRIARSGEWIDGTVEALRYLQRRLATDPDTLRFHAEDLWAASRHHQYRFADQPGVGAAWGELPRALSYALQSAERGRPRPTLIAQSLERIIDASSLASETAL